MRPKHQPEFKDALAPASMERFDGRATRAITRQLNDLEEKVGQVDQARFPENDNEQLYGYTFEIGGTEIKLDIEMNNAGEPVGEDKEFVEARNRLAVLRSRERSRGSRHFNFGFRKDRGRGPGGHGYNAEGVESIQEQYDEALSDFIARKITGHPKLNNKMKVTEAVSRSIIQEQRQMCVLERMAAEQKSGHKFMNFLRNHKKTRIAAGLALSGVSAVGFVTGQLEIAVPALAARSALSATGGYMIGRTLWDAVQGRRARRLPHDDIRMAGHDNGDFSGRLSPKAAFERFVKIHGAEARAGSQDSRRARLATRLGAGLVHDYYTDEIEFRGSKTPTRTRIKSQIQDLHSNIINPLQEERLKSDQTQSRRRHVAGLVGGSIMGSMPGGFKAAGILEVSGIGDDGHDAAAQHAAEHGSDGHDAAGAHGGSAPESTHETLEKSGSSAHSAVSPEDTSSATNGTAEVTIDGGSGNDTIILGSAHEQAGHGAHGSGLDGHEQHHELDSDIAVGELHVKAGGGFISTLQEQYDLSPSQADTTYRAMYEHLQGAPGTYMEGSDIRISAPGDLKLPDGAQKVLENHLEQFNKLPEHHTGPDAGGEIEPHNGGAAAPEVTVDPETNDIDVVYGTEDDSVRIVLPDADTPEGRAIHDAFENAYIPDTGLEGMTEAQANQAQTYLTDYVNAGGFSSKMDGNAQATAESLIERYAEASVDRSVQGEYGEQAMERLRHLLMANGYNLHNMSATEAEELEEGLAIINAG